MTEPYLIKTKTSMGALDEQNGMIIQSSVEWLRIRRINYDITPSTIVRLEYIFIKASSDFETHFQEMTVSRIALNHAYDDIMINFGPPYLFGPGEIHFSLSLYEG